MKTLMITACLLLVALVSAQQRSTTPRYFAPPVGGQNGGPNVNINDPNVNINDPNVNINNPNLAQPANGIGGQFSSYDKAAHNGGASFVGAGGTMVPGAVGNGGLSNSAENAYGYGADTQENNGFVDADGVDGSEAGGSVLNLDTDSDSEASINQGVNATALGVVLTIIIVLGIFGVVAIVLIRQRRQNAAAALE